MRGSHVAGSIEGLKVQVFYWSRNLYAVEDFIPERVKV